MPIPHDFINIMTELLGGESESLINAIKTQPETSIRLNPLYPNTQELVLASLGCSLDGIVPWANNACYLDQRPKFILDPLLHQGLYYVQDASSMFIEQAVRHCVKGPVRVLDLCAAPGGKSTHIAGTLPKGSLLVANEINRTRARILAENMIKWGHSGVMVTCNKPAEIGSSQLMFDLILVDAPCSGEGMFRKDEGAIKDWSLDNVRMCAQRQRDILEDIWPALKPGGFLIYSTCTFNTLENEDNICWLIERFGASPIPIDTMPEWNIKGALNGKNMPVYHFMQHRTRGEGLFICLLKKPGNLDNSNIEYIAKEYPLKSPQECRQWILNTDSYTFMERNDTLYAMPHTQSGFILKASQELYTLVTGVEVATLKGDNWIPCHSLAMSCDVNTNYFQKFDVSREQALAYLHCEALRLECLKRGIMLLTYMGFPLGFVKNVGSRANNMYPQEWRIRTNTQS